MGRSWTSRIGERLRMTLRGRRVVVAGLVLALVAACDGFILPAINIGTNTATLTASGTCLNNNASNPCTAWFQYWAQGATTAAPTSTSPVTTQNEAYTATVTANLTGLAPNTLYHAIFCGNGDQNISSSNWACSGPQSAGQHYYGSNLTCSSKNNNAPGQINGGACVTLLGAADLSNTSNFRTGSSSTIGTADLGRVLSNLDTPGTPIVRDGGVSVAYPSGQALWLFGDTQQLSNQGGKWAVGFLGGTTAAAGPYTAGQAPQGLHEVRTPGTGTSAGSAAAPFLPNPTDLTSPPGKPACGYTPAWLSGAALEPGSTNILISYAEICVNGTPFVQEATGILEYNPVSNLIVGGPVRPFPLAQGPLNAELPAAESLTHPVFGGDGYLYLYAIDNNMGGNQGKIYVARVLANPASWANGAAYKWYTGVPSAPWGAEAAKVSVINVSGGTPFSVSVGNYAATTTHQYVALVQLTAPAGTFVVLSAPTPYDGWVQGQTVTVPDSCGGGGFLPCYAVEGHPELSTTNNLVYSWYTNDDSFDQEVTNTPANGGGHAPLVGPGHLRLGSIAW